MAQVTVTVAIQEGGTCEYRDPGCASNAVVALMRRAVRNRGCGCKGDGGMCQPGERLPIPADATADQIDCCNVVWNTWVVLAPLCGEDADCCAAGRAAYEEAHASCLAPQA